MLFLTKHIILVSLSLHLPPLAFPPVLFITHKPLWLLLLSPISLLPYNQRSFKSQSVFLSSPCLSPLSLCPSLDYDSHILISWMINLNPSVTWVQEHGDSTVQSYQTGDHSAASDMMQNWAVYYMFTAQHSHYITMCTPCVNITQSEPNTMLQKSEK